MKTNWTTIIALRQQAESFNWNNCNNDYEEENIQNRIESRRRRYHRTNDKELSQSKRYCRCHEIQFLS